MQQNNLQRIAVVDKGRSVGICRVLCANSSRLELADGEQAGASFWTARNKVFFLPEKTLTAEDLGRASAETGEMEYGKLWDMANSGSVSLDDLARKLKGGCDDYSRLLVACAYIRERPLFSKSPEGDFVPVDVDVAQKIIASKRESLRSQKEDAVLQDRIAAGDLSMIGADEIDSILFDKHSKIGRMVDKHCARAKLPKPEFLRRHGVIESELDYHRRWVMHQFEVHGGKEFSLESDTPLRLDLSPKPVSLDKKGTDEIDDALSLKQDGGDIVFLRAHICSPIFAIKPEGDLDELARRRMSTIYLPQEKLSMLPAEVYREMSLIEGEERAVITVGVKIELDKPTCHVSEPRFEKVRIFKNSFYPDVAGLDNLNDLGVSDERLARKAITALKKHRGEVEESMRRRRVISLGTDSSVSVDSKTVGVAEELISEMMIIVNATLARLANENKVPVIYRTKGGSALSPKAHPKIGHPFYAWFTSPLRRYADLVNQRQVSSLLGNGSDFRPLSKAELAPIAQCFDARYAKIIQAQRALEKYWVLKHVSQHKDRAWDGTVGEDESVTVGSLGLRGALSGSGRKPGAKVRVLATDINLYKLAVKFAEAQ